MSPVKVAPLTEVTALSFATNGGLNTLGAPVGYLAHTNQELPAKVAKCRQLCRTNTFTLNARTRFYRHLVATFACKVPYLPRSEPPLVTHSFAVKFDGGRIELHSSMNNVAVCLGYYRTASSPAIRSHLLPPHGLPRNLRIY